MGDAQDGTQQAVKVDPDGRQLTELNIASDDGGFLVVARTLNCTGAPLSPMME